MNTNDHLHHQPRHSHAEPEGSDEMTEAPERIWAYAGAFRMWREKYPEHVKSPAEYIRADHVDALIAAACEGLVNQAVSMADGRDEACYIEDRMRDAIPDDARAALDVMIVKAREDALREIEEVVRRCIYYDSAGTGFNEDAFEAAILALIEKDTTDG